MPAVSPEVAAGCAAVADLDLPSELVGFARAVPGDVEACAAAGLSTVIVEHTVNPYLCKYVYDVDRPELVARLDESIAAARDLGLRPIFMGWDFFRCTLDYCLDLFAEVVERCSPESLVLVDTFGVATPPAVGAAFEAFSARFGEIPLEFHNHDDFGQAVGSAVAAVQGGARVVHTSVNGIGERTGNAPTEQVVAALEMLLGVDTGVRLERLTAASRLVEQVSKVPVPVNAPIVGRRVFQIETGVAVHSTEKLRAAGIKPVRTFVPSVVGQSEIGLLLGAGSGTASVLHHLARHGIELSREEVAEVLAAVKQESTVRKGLIDDETFLAIVERVRAARPVGG
jgi:methanogen homocitrate synthase